MPDTYSFRTTQRATKLGALLLIFMGTAVAKSIGSMIGQKTAQATFCGHSCSSDSQCGGSCSNCHNTDGTISYTCHN